MKNEQIKALIKEVLQEENSLRTKALQKEQAMRVQMYKDSITTAIGGVILYLIPIVMLAWAGFIFITGVFVTFWAAMTAVVMYMSIKDDNKTREKRVNKMLKQVN